MSQSVRRIPDGGATPEAKHANSFDVSEVLRDESRLGTGVRESRVFLKIVGPRPRRHSAWASQTINRPHDKRQTQGGQLSSPDSAEQIRCRSQKLARFLGTFDLHVKTKAWLSCRECHH